MLVCSPWAMIESMARSRTGFSFSLPFRFVRPLPFWRGVTPFAVPLVLLCESSGGSSRSSCFVRFLEEVEEEEERLGATRRGADSELGESGDFEVLVEPEGALRLPERRVSLGERGGPIIATWAMSGRMGRGELGREKAGPVRVSQTGNSQTGQLFSALGLAQFNRRTLAHSPSLIPHLSHSPTPFTIAARLTSRRTYTHTTQTRFCHMVLSHTARPEVIIVNREHQRVARQIPS